LTCVIEELASVAPEDRNGPLIVNPRTGLPYRQWYFREVWKRSAAEAGVPATVWNRDLRAGGITEARQAGAPTDDVAKTAGHSSKRTTARVYDRDTLEAARRVAKARAAHRRRRSINIAAHARRTRLTKPRTIKVLRGPLVNGPLTAPA
jgi:integrase